MLFFIFQLTVENLEEYVNRVVDATVKSGIARQMEAFKSGFNEVFALQFCGSLLVLVTGGCFYLHYDYLVLLYSGNGLIVEHRKRYASILLLVSTQFRYYQKPRL